MAERCGQIGRELRRPAEPDLRGAPSVAAHLGTARSLTEQRILTSQAAPQKPPPAQRVGKSQRQGRIARYGPGQHLPHGSVQPAGRGQLTVTRLQPGRSLLRHLQRVAGQCGGYGVLLAGLVPQLRPVGAQCFQHHIPGPLICAGARRDQQRAVHQPQHRQPDTGPGDRLRALQGERPGEHRYRPEGLPLVLH